MKTGFIGIIGRPNAGKSTLLNRILGEKIAITTNKPQTTRNSIRGIYTRLGGRETGVQMIFIDTPGIRKARDKLGEAMAEATVDACRKADVILFLIDGSDKRNCVDSFALQILRDLKKPKLLAINKIDKMTPERYKEIFGEYDGTGVFNEIYGISARKGKNIPELLKKLEEYMEEGPMLFPEDMVADHPERFIVSEIIREKLLNYLDREVPHGVAVEIESYEEGSGITNIGAVIYCGKKSHKGIIIGKQGKKLKGVGKSARLEIEALLGTKVYLELWVKVKENWRNSDSALSDFGYREPC